MSSFDLQSLKRLLSDFYNLTGLKVCLYDFDGNELYYYPKKFSSFCETVRAKECYDQRCQRCDQQAFANCRKTRSQYIYTCHAGLRECVSPILGDNKILGFIMLGQIKSDPCSPKELDSFPTPMSEQLREIYKQMPTISREKLLSAFHVLDACAGYEALKMLLKQQNDSIDAQIDHYIQEHFSKPLSVADLCHEFHLSRYEIYHISNQFFGCSPAEYVKKCRLNHACKLLSTTDLPINEIAVRCGIPDYNYFSKVFKANLGINPTSYKKQRKTFKT